jgi:predicted chitinase
MITSEQLLRIMPNAPPARTAIFLEVVNDTMERFQIVTPLQQAAFLAQIAHASNQLVTPADPHELLSGVGEAAAFWVLHRLNNLADQGDMRGITLRVRGTHNHYNAVLTFYKAAKETLGA